MYLIIITFITFKTESKGCENFNPHLFKRIKMLSLLKKRLKNMLQEVMIKIINKTNIIKVLIQYSLLHPTFYITLYNIYYSTITFHFPFTDGLHIYTRLCVLTVFGRVMMSFKASWPNRLHNFIHFKHSRSKSAIKNFRTT